MSCGGGPGGSSIDPPIPFTFGTATEKCFGLDLVTGTWKPMASMNYARTENFTLVSVDHGVLAIGGVRSGLPLIEIYNRDFDVWHSAAKRGSTWKSTFAKTFPIFFGTKVGRKTIRDDFAPFFSKSTISNFRHLAIVAILAIFGGYF